MKIAVIGAGGIGSYLIPLLRKTEPAAEVDVWDADRLERKNLDRQLFPERYIGKNKAEAMAAIYGAKAVPTFVTTAEQLEGYDLLFACPDNMPARRTVLEAADLFSVPAIICGNEYESASAVYYEPRFKDSPLDYRIRYAASMNDRSGDPTKSCTGAEQESNPQLALANQTAATFAMQLYWFWSRKFPQVREFKDVAKTSPIEYSWIPSANKVATLQDWTTINPQ